MNYRKYALVTLIAVGNLGTFNALAQSSSSTTSLPMDGNANTANVDVSKAAESPIGPKVSYFGIMSGMGLEMSGSHQASVPNTNSPMIFEHRVSLNYQTSENFTLGFQPRFRNVFAPDNLHMENANYRVSAKFSNVYKNDFMTLTLMPRVALPTSLAAHNSDMKPSPEMLAIIDFSPKDSRFSGQLGNAYMQGFYGNNASGTDYALAQTAMDQPWAELDYQVNPKIQAFAAFWPEFDANARINSPLHAVSNEIDLGTYFEVAKGWQVAPYIATEPIGMDVARIDKSMQFNFYVIGTVL